MVLEVGAGWISYWLDRMTPYMSAAPAGAFRSRRSRVFTSSATSGFPPTPTNMPCPRWSSLSARTSFFWASDFPHPDHTGEYIKEVEELAEKLTPSARRKVLGENVMRVYDCIT